MHKTSIKIKYRPSTIPNKEGSIFFQFIRNRKLKILVTPYKVYPEEWDSGLENVKPGCSSPQRKPYLLKVFFNLHRDYEAIKNNIMRQGNLDGFSLEEFIKQYRMNIGGCLLTVIAAELEQSLIQSGNTRTARAYRDAARNFIQFNEGHDFALERLNTSILEKYEKHMLDKGIHINTSAFYLRNLRMIHRSAFDRGLIHTHTTALFSTVFTGVAKTGEYAIEKDVLTKLASLDFSTSDYIKRVKEKKRIVAIEFARDLFFLSFYMRGISFFDLAYLKKNNVKNGVITYRQEKKGEIFKIDLTPEMKEIIDRYAEQCKASDYLLPILHLDDSYRSYDLALRVQNRRLNVISQIMGLEQKLSTFVTRHSWANILREQTEKAIISYPDSFNFVSLNTEVALYESD